MSEDFDALFQKGIEQFEAGQYLEALATFDYIVQCQPDNYQAWTIRGAALGELGHYEQAIESYDQALAINANDAQIWNQRGLALQGLGRYEHAIESYDRSLTIQPDNEQVWFLRGIILLEDLGYHEQAIESFDRSLTIQPDDPSVWSVRGRALQELGFYEQAIESFNKALAINPNDSVTWFKRGCLLSDLNHYEQAIENYDQALAIDPNESAAWYNRGKALTNLGCDEQAIESYNNVVKIEPNNCKAWINRGQSLENLGHYQEALDSHNHAITIESNYSYQVDSESYKAWSGRGRVLLKLGRYEESLESSNRAIEFQPNHDAWFDKGCALAKLGCYQESLESLNRAIELQPNHDNAWVNQGATLAELGCYQESLESLNRAIELQPSNSDAWVNQGFILFNLGRYEEAVYSCDCALAIQPDNYQAWINRMAAVNNSTGCFYSVAWTLPSEMQTPVLDQRGYLGAVNTLLEGFKYVPKQTESWARLHRELGRFYYFQKRIFLFRGSTEPYQCCFHEAKEEFDKALEILTEQDYPEARLEVLSDYIRLLYALKQPEQVEGLRLQGANLLEKLLNSPNHSDWQKRQLPLKFNNFRQLTVQQYVQQHQLTDALITAEKDKNACLQWLLQPEWIDPDQIETPTLSQIQNQLDASTAIIYWYLSPVALTTFIITANGEPQVLETEDISNSSRLQQLQELEDFLKTWRQEQAQAQSDQQWQQAVKQRLEQLKTLLNISDLVNCLPQGIEQLILVPHRDLHRLPLHALFPDNLTSRYLPSLQTEVAIQQIPNSNDSASYDFLALQGNTKGLPLVELERCQVSNYFEAPYDLCHDPEPISWQTLTKTLQQTQGVLHYCGHAQHNFQQPQKSQLELNVVHQDNQEQPLTTGQIYKLDLSAYRLVVLNACETGIAGQKEILTEYVGLGSTFLSSGVGCVVTTLWKVPDLAAFIVIKEFYRQVREEGRSKPEALKLAVRHLREMSSQQFYRLYAPIYRERMEMQIESDLEQLETEFRDKDVNQLQQLKQWKKQRDQTKINQDLENFDHLRKDPCYWAAFICQGN